MKFLSPNNIFNSLRQRYPVVVVNSLRTVLKCRSKRLSVKLELGFLQQCLEEAVCSKMKRVINSRVKYSHKMEKAFFMDEVNYKRDQLRRLHREQHNQWKSFAGLVSRMNMYEVAAVLSREETRPMERTLSKQQDHLGSDQKCSVMVTHPDNPLVSSI